MISRTCKNRPCSKTWAIAQAFCSNRPFFDPYEFTVNRHKQSRKHSRIILERFWKRFREFGAISKSWQNRPCSQSWAIAQAFCSKWPNFRPLRIHPKSTQTVAQAVTNHFRTAFEAFQRVWSDFQDLPKSAMFKTMGYSPGLSWESANFWPLRIHPISTQTVAQAVTNNFRTALEAFQRLWSGFQDLPKSAMFKTMGSRPGLLLKIGQISTLTNSP